MANEASFNTDQEDSAPFTKSEIISVFVGPSKEQYQLHARILAKSPFFKTCLRAGMKEQIEKAVNLPEDDPKAFGIVADWLYTMVLPVEYELRVLMSAYILANKLCMGELQNALMDVLQEKFCCGVKVDPADVGWVWENTGHEIKLRQFMVDAMHESAMGYREYWPSNADERHDLSAKLETMMSDYGTLGYQLYSKIFDNEEIRRVAYDNHPDPYKKNCKYHIHAAGEKCSKNG